jgi:hypothetical protein
MKEHVQSIADYEYEVENAAGNPNAEAEKAIFIRNMMTSYLIIMVVLQIFQR